MCAGVLSVGVRTGACVRARVCVEGSGVNVGEGARIADALPSHEERRLPVRNQRARDLLIHKLVRCQPRP